MELFDLGLAYVWEYDDDFIFLTEKILQNAGLNTFRITYSNLHEVIDAVKQRRVGFNCYLDRAWDVDETFAELGKMLNRRKTHIFNPYKNVLHAIDKASMHLEFITAGLNVPYSIIIPPHSEFEDIYISVDDLSILGRPFIIKPCNTTGGGIGVVTGAETLKEVLEDTHIQRINILYRKKFIRLILTANAHGSDAFGLSVVQFHFGGMTRLIYMIIFLRMKKKSIIYLNSTL